VIAREADAVPVSVPDSLDEALSPTWLTAALRPRFPEIEVLRVTPGPVVARISTNARFDIEYSGVAGAGPSTSLCVKGYFNEIGWSARHVGEPEAYFYRDLALVAGVRTLCSVYSDVDPESRHGVVITEDVVAQGGEFLDGRSTYTPDQAAASLSELARLHAVTWMQQRWTTTPWLRSRLNRALQVWGEPATVANVDANLNGPNGRGVPSELRDPQRLVDAYQALAAELAHAESTSPWCVIHADPHLGNVYIDAAGRPCLLDWQLVQRGMWYVDVGYHIASTLTVGDRRASERELLRHYLACLAERGVEPPPWDSAWPAVGRGIVHGFYLWSITTQVKAGIIEILLHRMGTAAADHGAFAGLRRSS
jgi:Phosphotransferase enzyme family